MTNEIKALGDAIVRTHDGQVLFNFGEVGKIINRDRACLPADLHAAGITVRKQGPGKYITAYDIAELILSNRIAPIDNTSRGTTVRDSTS